MDNAKMVISLQEQEIAKQRDLIELQREVLDVQRKQIADLRMAYELLRMSNAEMSWKIEFERNQPNEREEW